MRESSTAFAARLRARFSDADVAVALPRGEVTITTAGDWLDTARALRDEFGFEMLIDVCGVDYLSHGSDEWDTDVSSEGFSRGVEGRGPGRFKFGETGSRQVSQPQGVADIPVPQRRFAAVAQLLSIQHNQRVMLKCFAPSDDLPVVSSR